jgi:glycosyltransferase involved in cell wall biosynthesis
MKITDYDNNTIEVSVIIPCLNEEEGIGICVRKAMRVFAEHHICGEVVVSDNGSTDRSVEIAEAEGARVVHQPRRGYGHAYLKGFAEARGTYLIMADGDDTYDLADIPQFLELLRAGHPFVTGNRLNSQMEAGAMPWLHRWVGNPVLTGLLNLFFGARVSDVYCGMRGMHRDIYRRMNMRGTSWEFALEMIIKLTQLGVPIVEVPIVYHVRKGESKLYTLRAGWRSLSFMLLMAPLYLFFIPGLALLLVGLLLIGLPILAESNTITSAVAAASGSLVLVLAYQLIIFGLYSNVSTSNTQSAEVGYPWQQLGAMLSVERGLVAGVLLLISGITATYMLLGSDIMSLYTGDSAYMLLFPTTVITLAVQTIFASFFFGIIKLILRHD